MTATSQSAIKAELQSDILRLQGFKSVSHCAIDAWLGPIKSAFPNASFPLGAVHEFLANGEEDLAATGGFVAGILKAMMGDNGISLWVSCSRKLFPPSLKNFGLDPERFIFVDLQNEKEVLWAMDEALKCCALTAVIGEMREVSFTASRRLQLAVEQSEVTGFILRNNVRNLNTTACVSRWKIVSQSSTPIHTSVDELPGIGFPKWRVELTRVRNGKPGQWDIQWMNGRFHPVHQFPDSQEQQKKAG